MDKRLYRSRDNKMIAGVAGGLAEYFDIDPVIVRAVFVITFLGWGFGLLAYIVLWIIVPKQSELASDGSFSTEDANDFSGRPEFSERMEKRRKDRKVFAGIALMFIGFMLLIDKVFPICQFEYFWPLALIGFGGLILYKSIKHNTMGA